MHQAAGAQCASAPGFKPQPGAPVLTPVPPAPSPPPPAAPCLEFADSATAYASNENCIRMNNTTCLYYDNRYW